MKHSLGGEYKSKSERDRGEERERELAVQLSRESALIKGIAIILHFSHRLDGIEHESVKIYIRSEIGIFVFSPI